MKRNPEATRMNEIKRNANTARENAKRAGALRPFTQNTVFKLESIKDAEVNERLLFSLLRRAENAKGRLLDSAAHVQRKMERIIKDINEGSTINSLGELQGSGPEVDRLCGEYCQIVEVATEAAREFGYYLPTVEKSYYLRVLEAWRSASVEQHTDSDLNAVWLVVGVGALTGDKFTSEDAAWAAVMEQLPSL